MNAVYLVGPDNNNGLGLVRQFGKNGIKPVGIVIVQSYGKRYMCASKYWSEIIIVKNEDDAISVLSSRAGSSTDEKPVVIPYSDPAADALDLQYDTLSPYYILPSINKKAGAIHYWMDKQNQARLIEELGFNTLHTETISFDNSYPLDLDQKDYPLIWKPVSSLEGGKGDMVVIWNREQYIERYNYYRGNGWNSILEQKYLSEREEYVIIGAVYPLNGFISVSVIKNIRNWPEKNGVGCLSEFSTNKTIQQFSNKLLGAISQFGFSGLIDIELFRDSSNDSLYVSEINWRSSGRNWVSIFSNEYCAYKWYMNVIGSHEASMDKEIEIKGNVITENSDYYYWLNKKESFLHWGKVIKSCEAYALWDKKDKKPVIIEYREMIKQVVFTRLSQISFLKKLVRTLRRKDED